MKKMICVHYEVRKNGRLVLKNFGWFDSYESAKKTLKDMYPRCAEIVIVK